MMEFWCPAPPEETLVHIRCHHLAPYKPRQLVPGDYVFFTQERVTLQPGQSLVPFLDADITTYGQVNFIEWPLPGYQWYHHSMGRAYSSASGYHRLFEQCVVTNVHQHPIVIEEGSALVRVIMEHRTTDYPETAGNPAVSSPPLLAYLNFTNYDAYRAGPGYYTNVNFAPHDHINSSLEYLRSFTRAANGRLMQQQQQQ